MTYLTLILLKRLYTLDMRARKSLRTTQSLLKSFTLKVLKKLRSGTHQKKAENGIVKTERNVGLIDRTLNLIVKSAEKSLRQDIKESQSSAITTARLNQIEEVGSYEARVYDLMVEDCHEYFANGVLVHNCIDAARYALTSQLADPHKGEYHIY